MGVKGVQRRFLTEAEKEYLRKEYPRGDVDAMCSQLGIKKSILYQKARAMGISRDADLVHNNCIALGKVLAEKGAGKRFEKGLIPPNKGKKRTEWASPEGIKKMLKGQIKKGDVPPNRKEIGSERIVKGYVQVKVNDGCGNNNYRFKHHVIWEQHYGKIPDGKIVEFIDGNSMNFSIENLRCVSRAENVRRNHEKFLNLPCDLKEVIKLNNKLNNILK